MQNTRIHDVRAVNTEENGLTCIQSKFQKDNSEEKIYKVITDVSFPELPYYQTAYPTNLKYCKLKKNHIICINIVKLQKKK